MAPSNSFAISLFSPFKGNSIQLRCFSFKMILIRMKRIKKMSYHHIPFSTSPSLRRPTAIPTDSRRCAFHKMLHICTQFPLHSIAVCFAFVLQHISSGHVIVYAAVL